MLNEDFFDRLTRPIEDLQARVRRLEAAEVSARIDPPAVSAAGVASSSARDNAKAMPDDATDLKIALSEARTDTNFAEMMGEMRVSFAALDGRLGKLETRLDGLERSTSGTKSTIVITGIAVVGVLIAMLTYGQTWFGIGVSTRDVVKSAVTEYVQQHPAAPIKP